MPLETMPADAAVVAVIQALIPPGVHAIEEALQQEVTRLAGPRFAHGDGQPHIVRWGQQQASVFLADQRLVVDVPRVRDRALGREVPLATSPALQTPRAVDLGPFPSRARGYPDARVSGGGRGRTRHDGIALVLDGKAFAYDALVCARSSSASWARGFPLDRPLLMILDGANGLRDAVHQVFGAHAALSRCQRELRLVNLSAAGSLAEGLEETLTLHRLGVFAQLGTSFTTTNLIESVMARVEPAVAA